MMNNLKTKEVEKNIGYSFKDKKFLNRALTRKAYALEQKQRCEDQEVFRTLGDAVLVDLLIKSGCKTRGEITSKKKRFEREERLADHSLGWVLERKNKKQTKSRKFLRKHWKH